MRLVVVCCLCVARGRTLLVFGCFTWLYLLYSCCMWMYILGVFGFMFVVFDCLRMLVVECGWLLVCVRLSLVACGSIFAARDYLLPVVECMLVYLALLCSLFVSCGSMRFVCCCVLLVFRCI